MDGAETGTVTSSHVLVEGLNSLGPAHLTELLVHVVGTGARVVAEPDTEVLDLERALLVDLANKKKETKSVDLILTEESFPIVDIPR